MTARLGELLIAQKRVSPDQVQAALASQKVNEGRLGLNLVKLGFVSEGEISALLSRQHGVPSIALGRFDIAAQVIELVPGNLAHAHQVVPIDRSGPVLVVAATDPGNARALEEVALATGCTVKPVVASEVEMLRALARYYAAPGVRPLPVRGDEATRDAGTTGTESAPRTGRRERGVRDIREADVIPLEAPADEAPVVRFVNVVLASAIQKGASDIHIEPYENEGIVPCGVELREWQRPFALRGGPCYATSATKQSGGPVRPTRRPSAVDRGSPGPAGSASPPPPARLPPSVESSGRRATA